MHVLATHRLLVDIVSGLPLAGEDTLDGDFGKAAPGAADAAQAVVEHQLHAGAGRGFALQGAVEDHVLHRLAAQLGGARLTQHPAGGIDDVRLAAAVRPHDAHQLAGQLEGGWIAERLEARQFDLLEAHVDSLFGETPAAQNENADLPGPGGGQPAGAGAFGTRCRKTMERAPERGCTVQAGCSGTNRPSPNGPYNNKPFHRQAPAAHRQLHPVHLPYTLLHGPGCRKDSSPHPQASWALPARDTHTGCPA